MADKVNPLAPSSLERADYNRNIYAFTAADGMKFDDVLKSEFWAFTADRLNPRDIIEVMAADFTWFGRIIVADNGPNWAKVKKLEYVEWEQELPDESLPDGFKVEYKGASLKWTVVRPNGDRVKDKLISKSAAIEWAQKHVTQLAA